MVVVVARVHVVEASFKDATPDQEDSLWCIHIYPHICTHQRNQHKIGVFAASVQKVDNGRILQAGVA